MISATPPQTDPSETDFVCQPYDFEKILPMEAVREHTDTDDVEHLSDAMIRLYRRGALEAAEKYTGLLLTGRKTITEVVKVPRPRGSRRHGLGYDPRSGGLSTPSTVTHYAKYAFAQEHVIYYGTANRFSERVYVEPGQNRVDLDVKFSPMGLTCDPRGGTEGQISRIMYVAGYASECEIPAAVQIGALKYIAHVMENAGDIPTVTTAQGNSGPSNTLLNQANDPALASGAIDIWSTIRDSVL